MEALSYARDVRAAFTARLAAPLGLVCLALAACGGSGGGAAAGAGGSGGAGGRGPVGALLGRAGGAMLPCVPTNDAGVTVTGTAGAGGSGAPGACLDRPRRMPVGRMGIAAATAPDGLIYMVTWHTETDPSCPTSPLSVYDPGTGSDRVLASPPIAISTAPAAAFAAGKLVLIFGGTYLYDPVTDAWTQGSNAPSGEIVDALTVALDDCVYVIGGQDDLAANLAHSYDPATDQWTSLPPSPINPSNYGAAAVGGKIYLVGLNAVMFDPALATWTAIPSPSRLRIGPGVIGDADDQLLVMGGFDAGGKLAAVERFDPTTGRLELPPTDADGDLPGRRRPGLQRQPDSSSSGATTAASSPAPRSRSTAPATSGRSPP